MFPESSGVYIAQKTTDTFIVKVKGMYPALQLDRHAVDLGEFLRSGKTKEVSSEVLDNMEIFHDEWNFFPLKFINFGVFSKTTEFLPDSSKLYLSDDDLMAISGKYYRMCQQGVSPMKIIRALAYEFKTTKEQIINLVNNLDAQAIN